MKVEIGAALQIICGIISILTDTRIAHDGGATGWFVSTVRIVAGGAGTMDVRIERMARSELVPHLVKHNAKKPAVRRGRSV